MSTPQEHPLRGAELRKAVTEWTGRGCAVKINRDGSIDIKPPATDAEEADFIDWSRKP